MTSMLTVAISRHAEVHTRALPAPRVSETGLVDSNVTTCRRSPIWTGMSCQMLAHSSGGCWARVALATLPLTAETSESVRSRGGSPMPNQQSVVFRYGTLGICLIAAVWTLFHLIWALSGQTANDYWGPALLVLFVVALILAFMRFVQERPGRSEEHTSELQSP